VLASYTRLESGPVTDLTTTTVVHSSIKLLINDLKPDHSLNFICRINNEFLYLPCCVLNLNLFHQIIIIVINHLRIKYNGYVHD